MSSHASKSKQNYQVLVYVKSELDIRRKYRGLKNEKKMALSMISKDAMSFIMKVEHNNLNMGFGGGWNIL